jgi:hypothetical protein
MRDPAVLQPLEIHFDVKDSIADEVEVHWNALSDSPPFGVWPVQNHECAFGVDPILHMALSNCVKWWHYCLLAQDTKAINGLCNEI